MGLHWPWHKRQKVVIVRAKRSRATAEEMAERQKAKLGRQTALLKAAIDRAKLEAELKRVQGVDVEEEHDDDALDLATAQLRRLRRFEVAVGKRAEGEGPSKLETILNSAVGVAVVNMLGPEGLRQLVAKVSGQLPPGSPTAVTITREAVESVASSPPVAVVTEGQFEAEVPPPMGSQQLIDIFSNKTPEQAAEWLTTQQAPAFRQLVLLLRNTSDERLPGLLDELPRRAPQLADFVIWLRARPEWVLAVVQAVRGLGESLPKVSSSMGL